MPLSSQFTTVTPLSKAVALAMLVALPFMGFFAGMKFERLLITNAMPSAQLCTSSS